MSGFDGGSGIQGILFTDPCVAKHSSENSKDEEVFDASQYAFFGNNIVEETELGGLEEEEQVDREDSPAAEWDFTEEEDEILHSDIDHLERIFIESKTNRGPRSIDGFVHAGYRESSAAEFTSPQENFQQQIPITSFTDLPSSPRNHLLHRASSYPDHPQPHPKFSFPSYPPPEGTHPPDLPLIFGTSPPNIPPFSHSYLPGVPSFPPHPFIRPPTNQWLQQNNMFRGDHSTLVHNFLTQRPPNSSNIHPSPQFPQIPTTPLSNHHSKQTRQWPLFRSKHMSSDELDTILRIQIAATHTNDPYIDDYYNQARLAKKNTTGRKPPFCPTNLGARPHMEPHAFLQIDALGRLPFSSVRRPRPLLEIEPVGHTKPLEHEPLLAARAAIEDGLCVLLDVDDIDRFLKVRDPLRQCNIFEPILHRRTALLERLAASLGIADPLSKKSPVDDRMLLKLASLHKGRKLVSGFVRRLVRMTVLNRIVCMAVFRNLRFFFETYDSSSESSSELEYSVLTCVENMEDLGALSACLAAAVCGETPLPLRPDGGASLVLKGLLERSGVILRNGGGGSYRMMWESSFDEFFGVLTRYCFEKYDGMVGEKSGERIGREIPVEILRASLEHTNEEQRKVLLEFARRSIP